MVYIKEKIEQPLMMDQPTFVIMVNAKGEVRIVWFIFLADPVKLLKEGIISWPFMVKMISEDLNSTRAQMVARNEGISFDFVMGSTCESDMAVYVQEKTAADFSRAVVENDCKDLLQFSAHDN